MSEYEVAEKFFNEVCALAEQKMLTTHKLEGMHYQSMIEVLNRWQLEKGK